MAQQINLQRASQKIRLPQQPFWHLDPRSLLFFLSQTAGDSSREGYEDMSAQQQRHGGGAAEFGKGWLFLLSVSHSATLAQESTYSHQLFSWWSNWNRHRCSIYRSPPSNNAEVQIVSQLQCRILSLDSWGGISIFCFFSCCQGQPMSSR